MKKARDLRMRSSLLFVALVVVVSFGGCDAKKKSGVEGVPRPGGFPANGSGQTSIGIHVDRLVPEATPAPSMASFALARERVTLQDFEVTRARIATLFGLSMNAVELRAVDQSRYSFGAYNHSEKLRPVRTFDSDALGLWREAVAPLCYSAAGVALLPAGPEEHAALFIRIFGRVSSPEEWQAWVAFRDDPEVKRDASPAEAFGLYCVSLLSSAEFLYK